MSFEEREVSGESLLNRRNFLGLALLSGTAITLAACSGESTKTDGQEMRTVQDIDDEEIKVPVKPQRIVTLSEPTLDAALYLGVTPVGSVSGRGQSTVPNYLKDKAGDVPIIGSVAEVNYEQIGKLDPDLIIADATGVKKNSDAYDNLKEIAPVVYCGLVGGDWRINFRLAADALNMKDKGEELIKQYESAAAKAKEELAPKYADKTFAIVRWTGNGPALILKELPAGQALEDLGLKRPPSQDRMGQGHSDPVSLENISSIDADYMFLGTLGGASEKNRNAQGNAGTEGAEDALKKAEETSGFTDLNVYKEKDHIIPVDGSMWTSTGGPLLLNGIIENVKKELLK